MDIFSNFINDFPSPNKLIDANYQEVENFIRPLGLYNIRTSQLREMCSMIINEFNGTVPCDYNKLLQLKGVNDYIANSVLCFGFGKRVPIVDTNVIRIYKRLSDDESLKIKEIKKLAEDNLPKRSFKEFNWALLDLAAKICKAKNPDCKKCPINTDCRYEQKT